MSRFDDCLAFILRPDIEGGKVDDPTDRGGRTAYGITQATFNAWTHDNRDVWTITQSEIESIYHAGYWNACQCDKMPKGLDLFMFDSAVQHRPSRAIKFLQQVLGVGDDGFLGPITFDHLNGIEDIPGLISQCIEKRRQFYDEIIVRDPKQVKFKNGWMNRLDKLKATIGIA